MKDTPNESEEKLEAMLRRWGADQAAQDAQWAARRTRLAPRPAGMWLRTAIVAAAAVVVAVLATAYVTEKINDRRLKTALDRTDGLRKQVDPLYNQVAALNRQLADVRAKAESEMAQAATRHQADLKAAEVERGVLQTRLNDLQKKLTGMEVEYAGQLDAERVKSAEAERKLKAATTRLAEVEKSLLGLQTTSVSSAAKIAEMQKRLAAAGTELMLVTERYQKQLTAWKQAEQERDRLQGEVARLQAELARASTDVAPGPDGHAAKADIEVRASSWQGRKRQARRERLLARVARLRATIGNAAARELVDRLEVLLTRLELLDVNDPGQVRAFVGLVRGSNISSEIDSILASSRLPVAVRSWLLEARALLAENRRVG